MNEEFDDRDALNLLKLLHKYQESFAPDLPQTIPALAEDLAQSMDVTTDYADQLSREVQEAWL